MVPMVKAPPQSSTMRQGLRTGEREKEKRPDISFSLINLKTVFANTAGSSATDTHLYPHASGPKSPELGGMEPANTPPGGPVSNADSFQ